jgi:hypothetical protein
MATPRAYQLESASGLSPNARSYIKALIEEAIAAIPANKPSPPVQQDRSAALNLRISELERRYAEDDRFTLTRAKLLMFIEANGIK